MLLALRINVLAKGHSGISLETLHAMIQAFNGDSTHKCFTKNINQDMSYLKGIEADYR